MALVSVGRCLSFCDHMFHSDSSLPPPISPTLAFSTTPPLPPHSSRQLATHNFPISSRLRCSSFVCVDILCCLSRLAPRAISTSKIMASLVQGIRGALTKSSQCMRLATRNVVALQQQQHQRSFHNNRLVAVAPTTTTSLLHNIQVSDSESRTESSTTTFCSRIGWMEDHIQNNTMGFLMM